MYTEYDPSPVFVPSWRSPALGAIIFVEYGYRIVVHHRQCIMVSSVANLRPVPSTTSPHISVKADCNSILSLDPDSWTHNYTNASREDERLYYRQDQLSQVTDELRSCIEVSSSTQTQVPGSDTCPQPDTGAHHHSIQKAARHTDDRQQHVYWRMERLA